MFLKNKNIIFEIRRSKVTDYAALMPEKQITERDMHILSLDNVFVCLFGLILCVPVNNFSVLWGRVMG